MPSLGRCELPASPPLHPEIAILWSCYQAGQPSSTQLPLSVMALLRGKQLMYLHAAVSSLHL